MWLTSLPQEDQVVINKIINMVKDGKIGLEVKESLFVSSVLQPWEAKKS